MLTVSCCFTDLTFFSKGNVAASIWVIICKYVEFRWRNYHNHWHSLEYTFWMTNRQIFKHLKFFVSFSSIASFAFLTWCNDSSSVFHSRRSIGGEKERDVTATDLVFNVYSNLSLSGVMPCSLDTVVQAFFDATRSSVVNIVCTEAKVISSRFELNAYNSCTVERACLSAHIRLFGDY